MHIANIDVGLLEHILTIFYMVGHQPTRFEIHAPHRSVVYAPCLLFLLAENRCVVIFGGLSPPSPIGNSAYDED